MHQNEHRVRPNVLCKRISDGVFLGGCGCTSRRLGCTPNYSCPCWIIMIRLLLTAVAAMTASALASPSLLSDIEMAFTPFPPIAASGPRDPPPPVKNNFLSRTLGDNMVLQRAPAQAVLWGFAGVGNSVTVTMDASPHVKATTDAQG